MHRRLLRGRPGVVLSVLLVSSCNQRHPIEQRTLAVEPSSVLPPPAALPAAATTLLAITLSPRGIVGGFDGRGTVLLAMPAAPGGVAVALSSADPAVGVPPSVAVPAGRDNADFPVTTQRVPEDRSATIVASVPERNVTASLALWSVEPTFLSFASDPPDTNGSEGTRRVLPPTASFNALCRGSSVEASINEGNRGSWSARFVAPAGRPLAVGTYELGQPTSANGPYMFFSGTGFNCFDFTGQFTIREADYNFFGRINRFWASFELRCGGSLRRTARGDLRVTSVPTGLPPSSVPPTCTFP